MNKQEHVAHGNNEIKPASAPQRNAEGEEKDTDDEVHSQPDPLPEVKNELDPDDLVHHNPIKSKLTGYEERDPDDIVHGN